MSCGLALLAVRCADEPLIAAVVIPKAAIEAKNSRLDGLAADVAGRSPRYAHRYITLIIATHVDPRQIVGAMPGVVVRF